MLIQDQWHELNAYSHWWCFNNKQENFRTMHNLDTLICMPCKQKEREWLMHQIFFSVKSEVGHFYHFALHRENNYTQLGCHAFIWVAQEIHPKDSAIYRCINWQDLIYLLLFTYNPKSWEIVEMLSISPRDISKKLGKKWSNRYILSPCKPWAELKLKISCIW